ncbi:hypothetical protein SPHV1_2290018 [Novosphingobium sp. KN65.2]|nr:hypothetical protein SPHV1_2290018 [Novosphingobium sp. KN65.2]
MAGNIGQSAISSIVRLHPRQKPEPGSIRHTPVQGDGTEFMGALEQVTRKAASAIFLRFVAMHPKGAAVTGAWVPARRSPRAA